jgi:membrane-bound lytic murein transglycosylase F
LPLLAQRKWFTRVPYGYARGWEPVLYVNNIRSYYNILKWLTAHEEPEGAEGDIPIDLPDTSPVNDVPAEITET